MHLSLKINSQTSPHLMSSSTTINIQILRPAPQCHESPPPRFATTHHFDDNFKLNFRKTYNLNFGENFTLKFSKNLNLSEDTNLKMSEN